jgi:hypothetical protein
MSDVYLGIDQIVGLQVKCAADPYRRKAEEFPHNRRNLTVLAVFDRLAEEIAKQEGSALHRRIDAVINLTHDANVYIKLNEIVSAELHKIGSHGAPVSGVQFLEWYYQQLQTLGRQHTNRYQDIAHPNLVEHVENSEAVKAAKRAHKEAYQNAFAREL